MQDDTPAGRSEAVGSSKSRVLEKILIIFPLNQGPGTEFQAVKCYSFFVDSAKTSGTLVEPAGAGE
jgi:hypothetical protein